MAISLKKQRQEICLAVWPRANDHHGYIGSRHYPGNVAGCDSFWLNLRLVDSDNPDNMLSGAERDAVNACAIYVWFNDTGSLMFEVNGRDIHNLNIRKTEALLKRLKWFDKQFPENLGHYKTRDFRLALPLLLSAFGIKRAIQYLSGPDTFCDLREPLARIGALYEVALGAIVKEEAA